MLDPTNKNQTEIETLIAQIKNRARNLYATRQFMCAEAVLVTLNHALGGGLDESQAVAMAAPFSAAMGESGCVCGALSGAVMAGGLFLGGDSPYRHRREMRQCARQLHDGFKLTHGATCCRVISQKFKDDPKAHFRHCSDLTAETTAQAARLILHKRPGLIIKADLSFLHRHDSKIDGILSRLLHFFAVSTKQA